MKEIYHVRWGETGRIRLDSLPRETDNQNPSWNTASAPLTLTLFGAMQVEINGEALPPLRTRKGAWLLALLALRVGREVERDWLAAMLWPESQESQAHYNLRRSLSDLRSALGEAAGCITAPTSHTLRLDLVHDALDVARFDTAIARGDAESLDEAIALHVGPLLEGCTEDWAQSEATAREEAYLNALETRAMQALEGGDVSLAETLLRRAISADGYRETAWRLLMTTLSRQGNFAEVTLAYREMRLGLLRDLNTLPDPQTTTHYEQLRAESRRQTPPAAPVLAPLLPDPLAFPPRPALPRLLTPLIGREEQVQALADDVMSSRILTLLGSGGVGKTRLAVAIAEAVSIEFPDGVWFIDLAATTAPEMVPYQVAAPLQIREESGETILVALCEALACRRMLLILDNCEHLLPACAALISDLLQHTERLHILATSRQPLGVPGEHTRSVSPLAVPPAPRPGDPAPDPASLQTFASVNLFLQRVRQHTPDFLLTGENAAAVAESCRRLDGIPLALELAAARVRHLSPAEIARRLDDSMTLLSGNGTATLSRQQTLRASIEWSWLLLDTPARTLLARLSAFAGTFTLEATEAVCAFDPVIAESVLDLLGILVDSSMVIHTVQGNTGRYYLLEIMRQYAGQKLVESGEEATVRQRHADYYLAMAETAQPHLQGDKSMTAWLQILELEHHNLQAALDWYEQGMEAVDAEKGLRLAGAIQNFWLTRGYYTEGRHRLSTLLQRTASLPPSPVRAFALNGEGQLAANQGDWEAAFALHQQALEHYRAFGDRSGIAGSLNYLGKVARQQQKYPLAETYFQEALAILEGHPSSLTALIRYNLGTIAYRTGRFEAAHAFYTRSLQEYEQQDHRHQRVLPLIGLAHIAESRGQLSEAYVLMKQTLQGCRETGDIYHTAFALELASKIACEQEEVEKAAQLLGTAAALREQLGNRPTHAQQESLESLRQRLRQRSGEAAFEAAFQHGRTLSIEQASALATEASGQ